jgi:hypothetical protein
MICMMPLVPLAVAISQLIIAAFFFARHSCEYISVSGDRRTKVLCMRNVRFFLGRQELIHDDPRLGLADMYQFYLSTKKVVKDTN